RRQGWVRPHTVSLGTLSLSPVWSSIAVVIVVIDRWPSERPPFVRHLRDPTMRPFSITGLLVTAFVCYILYATYSLYTFLYPLRCAGGLADDQLCLNPAFKHG